MKIKMKMISGRQWFRLIVIGAAVVILWIFVRNSKVEEVDEDESGSILLNQKRDVERVKVAVYYEALCPDSRSFVIRQVEPTYQKLPENLDVQMVPYGKATTTWGDNGYKFECQHGPRECEANIIHACAIEVIKNPSVQLKFLSCMIAHNQWPENITRTCSEKLHVDAEPIIECYKSPRGATLLAEYGEMTNKLSPPVSFIPTITINDDSSNQIEILKDLKKEVCKHFKTVPAGCN